MNSDPVKQAWLSSVEIGGSPPLDDVRRSADKFYRRIWWRNMIEYVACAVVVVMGTYRAFTWEHPVHKAGFVLLVAAAIYAPWQLHRRTSPARPEMGLGMPIYEFLRGQLVRQRDALKNIFWWYILPFIPGMALVFAGNGFVAEIEAAGPPIWARWTILAGFGVFFALVIWLNRVVARRMQRRIDEIDALTGEVE